MITYLQFLQFLYYVDYEINDDFSYMIEKSMNFLELTEKDVAFMFGVSKKTVNAWIVGNNQPHTTLRKSIWGTLVNKTLVLLNREHAKYIKHNQELRGCNEHC